MNDFSFFILSYYIVQLQLFTQLKISQNDVSNTIEKNILQLDISIDDAQLEEHKRAGSFWNLHRVCVPNLGSCPS